MSTSVDTSFVRQYEADAHLVFQREGSLLRMTVRTQENVVGKSTTFQKLGKGTATTKSRHGQITPMNQDHTAIECTLEDFYAGDWVDKLDEAKIKHDERMAIARSGAMALGRKVDDQITTSLDGTTTTTDWVESSAANVRASLLEMTEALDSNDVPNDGMRFGALTPKAWAFAMTVEEFASADYVAGPSMSWNEGAPLGINQFKNWLGVMWCVHSGLPGKGTATAKTFAWHKNAVGYASGAVNPNVAAGNDVQADITWHGDRAAHFVNHMMSGGACLIDDTGVVEATVDDTAAIPTS